MTTTTIDTSKAKKWIHPGNGEVRVYINSGQVGKLWLSEDEFGTFKINYNNTFKYSDSVYHNPDDWAYERYIKDIIGEDVRDFADIVNQLN